VKTIVNKTLRPLRIRLPGGKTLHLGSMKSGQISDQAAEDETLRKLVQGGSVEILGDASHASGTGGGTGAVPEATHGHPPTTVILPKGNR